MNDVGRQRTERSAIAFLAFIGVLMAFGIDAALPAFDQLAEAFDLDERGMSPAVTGTVYFAGMAVGQLFYGILADLLRRIWRDIRGNVRRSMKKKWQM